MEVFTGFSRFAALASLLLAFSPGVRALDVVPYQAAEFDKARAAGKVTAVQFHSGWCPICVMQARGVDGLKNDKQFEQVTVFRADFGKEEALRKSMGVNAFSTLVVFRGDKEVARTTGDFQSDKLKQLFAKAF